MNIKTTLIAVLTPFWLATSLMAGGIEIVDQKLTGVCEEDSIDINTADNGNQYIEVELSESFMVKTSKKKDYRKKRCNIIYTIKLPKNKKLDLMQMAVDGVYTLASEGDARLTVKHRVKNYKSVGSTFFFATDNGDKKRAAFHDHTGTITVNDLPAKYRECGATIPLKTSIIASVSKEDLDTKGTSRIELDDAVSDGHHRICKVETDPCNPGDNDEEEEEDDDEEEEEEDDEEEEEDDEEEDEDDEEEDEDEDDRDPFAGF